MRHVIILLVGLMILAGNAFGQDRLDLQPLPGENAADPAYRITLGGRPLLDVFPLDEDRARLVFDDGRERVLDLPPAAPFVLDIPAFAPPVYGVCPQFAVESFATLLDGLALLLADAAQAGRANGWRFAATVRLTTNAGRVGHYHTEVIDRGARLPDESLDTLVERFLAAGPLPPLRGGRAIVDVVATVAGGNRPVLTVWIERPRGAQCLNDLDAGYLFHEPLGLPAAVRRNPAVTAAVAAYADDCARARADLLARMAQEKDASLFGNWRIDVFAAESLLAEIMARRGAGEMDPLLYLEARLLLCRRRVEAAIAEMSAVAAGAADRSLAEEARFLALAWQRRRLPPALSSATAGKPPSAFHLETALLIDEMSERSLGERLAMIRELLLHAGDRLDFDLLVRSRAASAASALAATAGEVSPRRLWRDLPALVPTTQPLADRLLFAAAAHLLDQRRDAAASELLRDLLARQPTSPLAPEAAWRLVVIELRGERPRAAAELALTVHELFGAESAWGRRRGAAGDSAPWAYGLQRTVAGATQVRERALLLARDFYFDAYRRTGNAADLAAAEHAARTALDTVPAAATRRRQWVVLGDILLLGEKTTAARRAYANVALAKENDSLRHSGLRRLSACLTPSASRVAAALRDDPEYGELLAPLRP